MEMREMSTYDLYEAKYQYYCFYPEGRFLTVTMTKDKEVTYKELNKYKEIFPDKSSWRVVNPGVIYIEYKDNPNMNADWSMFIPKSVDWLMDMAPVDQGEIGMLTTDKKRTNRLVRILDRIK